MGTDLAISKLPSGFRIVDEEELTARQALPPGFRIVGRELPATLPRLKKDWSREIFAAPPAETVEARGLAEPSPADTQIEAAARLPSRLAGELARRTALEMTRPTAVGPPAGGQVLLAAMKPPKEAPLGTTAAAVRQGVSEAAGDTAEMLLSPEMVAIGAGMGWAPAAIKTLVSLGFSVDMAKTALDSIPEIREAFKKGDIAQATRLAGNALVSGIFALGAARHGARAGTAGLLPERYRITPKEFPPPAPAGEGLETRDGARVPPPPAVETKPVEEPVPIKRLAEIPPPELQLAYSKLPEGYKIVEPFSLLPGEEEITPALMKTVEKPAESAKLEITEEPTYVRKPANIWMESSIEGKSTESSTHAAGETAALPSTIKGLGETVERRANRRRAIPDEIESRVPAIIENWASQAPFPAKTRTYIFEGAVEKGEGEKIVGRGGWQTETPLYDLNEIEFLRDVRGTKEQINKAFQTRKGAAWKRIEEAARKQAEKEANFEQARKFYSIDESLLENDLIVEALELWPDKKAVQKDLDYALEKLRSSEGEGLGDWFAEQAKLETRKAEQPNELQRMNEQANQELARQRGEEANRIVGQLGLKAGAAKPLGSVEGSELFGSAQQELQLLREPGVKEVALSRISREEEPRPTFPSVGKQEMSGPAKILYDRFQSGIIRPGEYSIKGKPGLIESVELAGDRVYVTLKTEARPKSKIPERTELLPLQKNSEVILTNYDRVPPEMAKAWLEGGAEFPLAKERPGEAGLMRLGGPQGPRTGDLFTMPESPREKPTWLQFWNKLVRANKDKFVDIKRAVARLEGERGLRQIELSAETDPYKIFRTVYGGTIQGNLEVAKFDLGEIARRAEKAGLGDQVTQYLTAKGQWERSYNVTLEHIRDWKKGMADKKAELRGLKNSIKTMERMHVPNVGPRHVAQMRALKAEAMNLVRQIRDQSRLLNRLIREVREGAVIPKDARGQRRNKATLDREIQQFESRLSPEQLSQVKALASQVFDFNEKILRLERVSGLISEETFQKFSGRGREYIPSYREAGWTMRDETLKGTGMNPQDVEDLLLAGLKNTKDPWEASLQKAANVIQSAERNRATRSLIDYLSEKAAQGDPLLPKLLGKDELPSHGSGAVSYFADGKKYRYELSVELANAVNVVNPEVLEFLGKTWYRCLTQMTRMGFTGLNFGFMMKNAPRDIRRMMIVSKAGVNKPLDIPIIIGQWIQSIGDQLKRSPEYREALEAGAFYGTMQRMIKGEEISPRLRSKIKSPFRGISGISNLIEQATKLTTYKRARAMGMTPAEAAWETRNWGGSPDFTNRGVHNQLYDLMTLFLNARIEGKASDLEAIRRDPKRTLVKWMVIGTAAELALQAYNCQFRRPDGSWEVDHISPTDSVNYNVFILPWMETTRQGLQRWASVKVAKSEYEQMLMNPIQNLARGLFGGKVDGPQTALDFAVSALPLSSDVDKDHWFRDLLLGGMGVMNPVLKEPVEQFANLDFHRKVPIVPKSEQMRSAELQYGKSTAEVWKKVGAWTGTSPRRWQHAARIFGEPAEILTDVSEWTIGGKKPGERNLPLFSSLKRVVRGSEVDKVAVENTEKFYDLLERSNKTRGDLRLFKETGAREKMRSQLKDRESRELLRLNGMLNRVARQLAELRDQRDLIERRVEEPKRRQRLLNRNYQTTQSLIQRVLKFAHQQ